MGNESVTERLGTIGIIPVVALEDETAAVPLAEALTGGGLPCVEVTFRTKSAAKSIEAIAKKLPDVLVGAGTVLTPEQVDTAVASGAKFIVSPGFSVPVVERCRAKGVPVFPGVMTPSEVQAAVTAGLDVLKFFPAEPAGGLEYLSALSAPFGAVKFIPTGGIDAASALSYLKKPFVHACGGSWMVKKDLLAAKKFDEVRALTAQAVKTMLGFHIRHLGMNSPDKKSSGAAVNLLVEAFGFGVRAGETSHFVNEQIEVMDHKGTGDHGHIAIGTNFVDRAIAYLAARGINTKPETVNMRNGRIHTIYLDIEIEGFALHLIEVA